MLYCVPLCSCGNCDIRHMVTWITPLVGEDKQMQGGILQGILCQQCCHQDIFCRSVNLIWWPDNGQANMDQTEFAHFETRSIIWEEVRQGGKAANGQRVKFVKWIPSVSASVKQLHKCTMSYGLLQVLPACTNQSSAILQCVAIHITYGNITMYCPSWHTS